MKKSKFVIEEISIKDWKKIYQNSEELSFFSDPDFHLIVKGNCKYFIIKKSEEVCAYFFVPTKNKEIVENDFLIYCGVYFKKNNLLSVKQRDMEFKILELIATYLPKKYKKINLTLSPNILDVRPFQWFNYIKNDKFKYKIQIKYTSILNIKKYKDFNDLEKNDVYNNMETVRRYSIRQAIKEKAKIRIAKNANYLVKNYFKTLKLQGVNISKKKLEIIKNIYKLLKKKKNGEIFEVLDKQNNILYSLMYCWKGETAYFLYGSGDPKNKTNWKSTIGHWYIFNYLKKNSFNFVDFEGVNSPNRGWFKETFGGKLHNYFHINYGK